jgi:hypothetical protein
MRASAGCLLLLLAITGCRSPEKFCLPGCGDSVPCCEVASGSPMCDPACPPAAEPACPAPVAAKPAPPRVEFKTPPPVRVKMPSPEVTTTQPCAPPAMAPPMHVSAPPPGYPPPQAAPGPLAPAGMVNVITSTEQTVSAPRARLALSIGYFRMPIPYPRLISLPGEQEVVTRQTQQVVPAGPPLQAVPAPALPPLAVPVVPAPVPAYAPPAYAPPMSAQAPAAPVPIGVAVVTTAQQPVPPQQAPPPCPAPSPAAPAACPPVSLQEVEQLKRDLEAITQKLQQRAGTPAAAQAPLGDWRSTPTARPADGKREPQPPVLPAPTSAKP